LSERGSVELMRYDETHPPGQCLLMKLQRDLIEFNADELRAAEIMFDKIKAGRIGKPPLDIATDKRDWRKEAIAEHADACWYLFFALVNEGRQ
jgi:hypothetical protein